MQFHTRGKDKGKQKASFISKLKTKKTKADKTGARGKVTNESRSTKYKEKGKVQIRNQSSN